MTEHCLEDSATLPPVSGGPIDDERSKVLDRLFARRFIVVTGKGGTGKTVLAASLARLAAARGKRVLACEVGRDPNDPSPLLDLLDKGRAPTLEPQPLAEGLLHAVLRGDDGVRSFLREVLPFKFMADRALKVDALRRFLAAAPAFAEMGVLFRGLDLLRQKRRDGSFVHELMILDAPASGHTLAFASLPDTVLKVFTSGPVATAARDGIALIRDPERTTAVIATLPEPLPVSEASELYAGLVARQLDVGAIVVNQMPVDPFDGAERAALREVIPTEEVLGRRALVRIDRAAAALRRLSGLGAPVFCVPAHTERGEALVAFAGRSLEVPE